MTGSGQHTAVGRTRREAFNNLKISLGIHETTTNSNSGNDGAQNSGDTHAAASPAAVGTPNLDANGAHSTLDTRLRRSPVRVEAPIT
jgi:hypothetical protein